MAFLSRVVVAAALSRSVVQAPLVALPAQRRWLSRSPAAADEENDDEAEIQKLKSSKTYENLVDTIYEQALDQRRFEYFAEMAEVAGKLDSARALREVGAAEARRATQTMDLFFNGLGDPCTDMPFDTTQEALEAAIASLNSAESAYAERAETARTEGFEHEAGYFEDFALAAKRQAKYLGEVLEHEIQVEQEENEEDDQQE